MIFGTDTFSKGFYYPILSLEVLHAALSVSIIDKEHKTWICRHSLQIGSEEGVFGWLITDVSSSHEMNAEGSQVIMVPHLNQIPDY
jgi:hypothetical protein